MQVNQLVEEHLEDVAHSDSGVGGDRKAEFIRHGKAETIRAPARASHPELGLSSGQRTVCEHGQGP
jgi:hypothetical protein